MHVVPIPESHYLVKVTISAHSVTDQDCSHRVFKNVFRIPWPGRGGNTDSKLSMDSTVRSHELAEERMWKVHVPVQGRYFVE